MPLASLSGLLWYGPAAGAVRSTATASTAAAIKGRGRTQHAGGGAGAVTLADATRLKHRPMSASGLGAITQALPKGRARPTLHITIGELSQDDVSGALQNLPIEDGLTLRDVLRLLLAVAAGDATQLDGNPIFKSADGSKNRLAATIASGARTITTKDPT